ncbi:MAG: oleate hydratase [Actinobacteria bacterium]|nr:oleate hydratase [Actinomycetota bacterium]
MLFWDQINATPPEGVQDIRAHIVGGGIAGLAAAAFLTTDGYVPAANITVYDAQPVVGGSMDGTGDAVHGYINRGERELEAHMECLWYLFGKVPSLKRPGRTVLDETREFNGREPISSHWRLLEQEGAKADYHGSGLTSQDQADLLKLFTTPESQLGDISAEMWFRPSFFESNLWWFYSSMLSFDTYHSVIEVRRYFLRFMHLGAPAATLQGILHTEYNEFDSLIRPLLVWLDGLGVRFATETRVSDIEIAQDGSTTTVTGLAFESRGETRRLDLTTRDLVFFTNGSLTQNSNFGDNTTPVPWNLDREDRGLFTLWERLAAQDPKFGRPEKFISWPDKTFWTSFFVTIVDFPEFVDRIERTSGDKPGNGGLVTIKDSSWGLSFMLHSKPFYPNQPENADLFWAYGLRGGNVGDFVKKPMRDATGDEILTELLHHLGFSDLVEPMLEHSKVSLAGMPYITSQFMPRALGDRPQVIPEGCVNLAFLGQFVETEDDCVFTVEGSVRTGLEAAYGLLHLDKPIIRTSKTRYDIRHLAAAARTFAGVDELSLGDLLKMALPAARHPRELVEVIDRIPDPDDVRPGAEPCA